MRKDNRSRDQLIRSSDRRIKHLMIGVLERLEDFFPDIDNTRDGGIFKADIRTAFNDVMRATRDEIHDYDIEYRPLRLTDDNILAMTQAFMKTIKRVEFGWSESESPWVKIYADLSHAKVMEAIRSEFGTGVLVNEDDGLVLEIIGTQSCVDSVFSIMDRYRLHADVRPQYTVWRSKVVEKYRR